MNEPHIVSDRTAQRRVQDERIAAEPKLPPLNLPPDAVGTPVEVALARIRRRPLA